MDEKKTDAEKRVDALVSGRDDEGKDGTPPPGQASQRLQARRKAEEEGSSGRGRLTEKQRVEARKRRRATKGRRKPAGSPGSGRSSSGRSGGVTPVEGNVLSRGMRATGIEFKRTFSFLGRSLLAGLDALKPVGSALLAAVLVLVRLLGRAAVAARSAVAAGLAGLGRILLALDRAITPRRALIAVGGIAAALLVYSQFSEFRAIEIGQPGYGPVQDLTHAPRVEAKTPFDTHSALLVLTGVVALAATALSTLSTGAARQRLLGLVIVGCGAATVLVGLLIDLPAGLDTGGISEVYSGVAAVLLPGFWLQLVAGSVLLVTGLGLMSGESPSRKAARPARRPANVVAGGRA